MDDPQTDDSREWLLAKLQSILDGDFGRIHCAFSDPAPVHGATWTKGQRIMIQLKGVHHVVASVDREVTELHMEPGDVLYALPMGWSAPIWDEFHQMFSIVIREGFSRFLWYTTNDRGDRPGDPQIWHHTKRPMSRAGMLVLKGMDELAFSQHRPGSKVATLRACLELAADELMNSDPLEQGKAWNTYMALQAYIEENCQQPIDRTSVAAALGLHPNYVSRIFRRFAAGFTDAVTKARIERSMQLLLNPALTVEQVAVSCGYNSCSYFIKQFRETTGVTPVMYRTTT